MRKKVMFGPLHSIVLGDLVEQLAVFEDEVVNPINVTRRELVLHDERPELD